MGQPQVALFDRLDPTKEHIFYDVVCGLPLFIAPRGRSFDEFREESIHHGWPSFRPEEMISENVILHENGRMESKCLTHLGHNLPKDGVDRYCIDLVCIAGTTYPGNEFNASSYVSAAEKFSGKYKKTGRLILIVVLVLCGIAVLVGVIYYAVRKNKSK